MGDMLNPMKLIGDAMNSLKDIGQTLEDVGSGNFGKLGQDVQKDFGDAMNLGMDGLSMTNPELAPFLQAGQQLMGLANQGGQFNPSQVCGFPNPFSQGGIPGGAFNNPWSYAGGGYGGAGGAGGYGGAGGAGGYGGAGGAGGVGGNFYGGGQEQQLDANLQAAYASGDPQKIFQAQQAKQKYDNYWAGMSKIAKDDSDQQKQLIANL